MAAPTNVIHETVFPRIMKDAEKLQSFVIDEIALTELLERAWRPVGKKIIKQLSGVIDFKKGTFHQQKGLNISLWITEDMYDSELGKIWRKIEKTARKFLERAYNSGIEEEGRDPFEVTKSQRVIKSVSSVYAERKSNAINILLNIVNEKFMSYAREIAVPSVQDTITGLGKIDRLSKEFDEQYSREQLQIDRDAAEIARYEMLRKMRVLALDKARAELIAKLKGLLDNCQVASGVSNLSISRAHHFGFLDWAQENGIEYYEVSAKLDSKTCAACLELDGKVFKVSDAIQFKNTFLSISDDKEKLKEQTPFLTKKDAPGVRGVDLSQFLEKMQLSES